MVWLCMYDEYKTGIAYASPGLVPAMAKGIKYRNLFHPSLCIKDVIQRYSHRQGRMDGLAFGSEFRLAGLGLLPFIVNL